MKWYRNLSLVNLSLEKWQSKVYIKFVFLLSSWKSVLYNTEWHTVVMNSQLIVQIIITGHYFSATAWKDADMISMMIRLVWRNHSRRKIHSWDEATAKHIRCGQTLLAVHKICCQYEVNIETVIEIIRICK